MDVITEMPRAEFMDRLVEFGNYMLSEQRKQTVINEDSMSSVTDADLANFFYSIGKPYEYVR